MSRHFGFLAGALLAGLLCAPVTHAQHASAAAGQDGAQAAHADDGLRFINPPELAAPAGYTHVVEAPAGHTLYLSGQIAFDREGKLVGAGDFGAQAMQVFANLDTALKGAGASFGNVVKLTMYVTDMSQLAALRTARDRYIDRAHPPASTLVEVRKLAREGLMLEVDAIAVVPD